MDEAAQDIGTALGRILAHNLADALRAFVQTNSGRTLPVSGSVELTPTA